MKLNSENTKSFIMASVIFIAGLLLCISTQLSSAVMSYTSGTVLLIIGALFVVMSALEKKKLLTADGIIGAVIVSFGILFMTEKLSSLVAAYAPYFLICLGAVTVMDIFVTVFIKKEKKIVNIVLTAFIGTVLIVLGILILTVDGLARYIYLTVGLLMIALATFLVFVALTGKNKTVAEASAANSDSVQPDADDRPERTEPQNVTAMPTVEQTPKKRTEKRTPQEKSND